MMLGYYDHLSAWGWFGMITGMVLFWGLIFAAILFAVRGLNRRDSQPSADRATPEQLLAERFARGEIDETEYTHRLDTLHGRIRS